MIPLSVPCIRGNESRYIQECLDTAWVSSAGKYVDDFERRICEITGAGHAVACASGTAALHVALRLAGVRPGDEVMVPSLTFIAPVNAIRYLNADPVFMDCDRFYNIDAEKTVAFLKQETEQRHGAAYDRRTGRRIAAMVPVHIFGHAADLSPLLDLCREKNVKIVEDASESLGTRYCRDMLGGRHTGTAGDIGCLSFNGNKIMTTGGGGMLLTHDAGIAEQARYLTTQAKDDAVRYIHHDIGYNYRMTNVAAAMGVAQLEQLTDFLRIKRKNYETYRTAIDAMDGLTLAEPPAYACCNHWFYSLQIDAAVYGMDRDALMQTLSAKGIQTRPLWHPNHLQKPYANSRAYRIERTLEFWRNTLNIPCSVGLTDQEIEQVIGALKP